MNDPLADRGISIEPWTSEEFYDVLHNVDGVRRMHTDNNVMHIDLTYRVPRIVLADGTSLSAQTGRWLHCTPDTNEGPYTSVEVGYPSRELPDSFAEYCEDPDDPLTTVYSYVPIHLLMFFIGTCGGVTGYYNDEETQTWLKRKSN